MEEVVVVVVGLIFLQFVYSGNSIMLSYLRSLGLNPLTFAITSALAIFIVLSPFASVFKRRLWPRQLSFKLMVQLVLAAVGGSFLELELLLFWVTLFQTLFMKGIKMTAAAMGTAMPNLCLGLIFIIAWITRLEKVDVSCIYSKVKIHGTALCVSGALILNLMHSTMLTSLEPRLHRPRTQSSMRKRLRVVYIFWRRFSCSRALTSFRCLREETDPNFPLS